MKRLKEGERRWQRERLVSTDKARGIKGIERERDRQVAVDGERC